MGDLRDGSTLCLTLQIKQLAAGFVRYSVQSGCQ